MGKETIKELLLSQADEKYRAFHLKLVPGLSLPMIGVRLPALRKIAKEISKKSLEEILAFLNSKGQYYEEVMLQGLVIGYMKCTPAERLTLIREFVSKIDNWAVCDCFCSGLKFTEKNKELVFDFLTDYFQSEAEYDQRFAYVMAMDYFLEPPYLAQVFARIDGKVLNGYYSQMAVAWCLSIAYIKAPQETVAFLKSATLDDFTYEKSLQKIRESLRVSPAEKEKIKAMSRKQKRED
ncbi:MAG: DNA alkylation repair protein [Peptococcaceae bacterium]|nr:DNA alkylation repair protein [Peptococcaceae bacterium]